MLDSVSPARDKKIPHEVSPLESLVRSYTNLDSVMADLNEGAIPYNDKVLFEIFSRPSLNSTIRSQEQQIERLVALFHSNNRYCITDAVIGRALRLCGSIAKSLAFIEKCIHEYDLLPADKCVREIVDKAKSYESCLAAIARLHKLYHAQEIFWPSETIREYVRKCFTTQIAQKDPFEQHLRVALGESEGSQVPLVSYQLINRGREQPSVSKGWSEIEPFIQGLISQHEYERVWLLLFDFVYDHCSEGEMIVPALGMLLRLHKEIPSLEGSGDLANLNEKVSDKVRTDAQRYADGMKMDINFEAAVPITSEPDDPYIYAGPRTWRDPS